MTTRFRRIVKGLAKTLLGTAVVLGAMQLIPYGRAHDNPDVIAEPAWDSPRTRELAVRACFDCHSNETKWPWYTDVAPMSWVVQRDVDAGRSVINFSEWNRPQHLAEYADSSIRTGNMPPTKYTLAHPEARLTDEELAELARGLDATFDPKTAER